MKRLQVGTVKGLIAEILEHHQLDPCHVVVRLRDVVADKLFRRRLRFDGSIAGWLDVLASTPNHLDAVIYDNDGWANPIVSVRFGRTKRTRASAVLLEVNSDLASPPNE